MGSPTSMPATTNTTSQSSSAGSAPIENTTGSTSAAPETSVAYGRRPGTIRASPMPHGLAERRRVWARSYMSSALTFSASACSPA